MTDSVATASRPETRMHTHWLWVGAVVAGLGPLALFAPLTIAVERDETNRLDATVYRLVHAHAAPILTALMNGSSYSVMLLAALAACTVLVLVARRQLLVAAVVVAGELGGYLLNVAVKVLIQRPPPGPSTPVDPSTIHLSIGLLPQLDNLFSYPSGHTVVATLTVGLLVYLWRGLASRRWRWLFVPAGVAYVGIVGLSRVYLDTHYPADVLGGFLLAVSWLTLALVALEAVTPSTTDDAVWLLERR